MQRAAFQPCDLLYALENVKQELLCWSSKKHDDIPRKLNQTRQRIRNLTVGQFDEDALSQAQKDLQQLLSIENDYWQQRSRSNWLRNGDRNTAYFYHHANHRHRCNSIKFILDANGK